VIAFALAWLSLVSAARAGCEFDPGSPVAPFRAEAEAGARVALEVRLEDGSRDPSPILHALTEHGVPATILVEPTVAVRWSSLLSEATDQGHDVGVLIRSQRDLGVAPETILQVSVTRWWQELKQARHTVKRAAGQHPTIFAIDLWTRAAAVALEQMRVRMAWSLDGGGGAPRRLDTSQDSAGSTKLLGWGGYNDTCGGTLPSWTPAAFDRVADATRAGWPVRVELRPSGFDAALLDRWLDRVAGQVRFVTGKDLAGLSLQELGAGGSAPPPPRYVRRIDGGAWLSAAHAIEEAWVLPRTAPGGLDPTEAFLAFALLLDAETPPTSLELGPLAPPLEVAQSSLRDPVPLDAARVRDAAEGLSPTTLQVVPAVVTVGDVTLTAAEFLRVMAQVVLSHDPVARRVGDPDPFAPGGGWGTSG
jgi:hypothetical protein